MNSSRGTPQAGSGREAPSGQQFEIQHRATVAEVGGGLRSCRLDGEEVLDGYGLDERCTGARGLPLIPWPNRIEDGAYRFDGTGYQVPLTEPDAHNAIHGLPALAELDLPAAQRRSGGDGNGAAPADGLPVHPGRVRRPHAG
ncbi:MAG: hypothetical protein ACR2MP_30900 [Streptosporangiaceae bacterium]